MRSLFLKIFLWFWATVILIGAAMILSFVIEFNGSNLPWRSTHIEAERVVSAMDQGGEAAASALLSSLAQEQHRGVCLFTASGTPIAGTDCAGFQSMATQAATGNGKANLHSAKERYLVRLKGPSGKVYIFASESQWGQGARKSAADIFLRLGTVLLISSSVCYMLTRRLTEPILTLRTALRGIAEGQMEARVPPAMERRGDAFGDLGRDFNAMATRIDDLLTSQRQLISDVSHELRSPLARLNVALDLARTRLGNDPSFEGMTVDLERLAEMIGRLLTVARLESHGAPIGMTAVNLSDLAADIVDDSALEARQRGCTVSFESSGEYFVTGNEALLRSAVENIVRNAVYYTAAGTEVRVAVDAHGPGHGRLVTLRVMDQGPGIPEAELGNIFKPFYRVADARDRQSGGAGLGLAIVDRVVRLHRGSIRASNRAGGGLEVSLELTLALRG